ncbi:unnamed protein product [Diatraea saccharalis]|uniref:PHD-type domain-containing protein n=1 Tax=Diatraea saccharalis TaxID=40085 RepID=A0A9N9WG37_9NEOP|nr:unnamed protein product [Diatraea saccharalis]
MNCSGCLNIITDPDSMVTCSKCRVSFHNSCVASSLEGIVKDQTTWMCPACKPKRGNADGTPVRTSNPLKLAHEPNVTVRSKKGVAAASPVNMETDGPVTSIEVRSIIRSEIAALTKHLNETLAQYVNKELKSIKAEIEQVKESMNFMNDKYEEIKSDISTKFMAIHELQKENEQLKIAFKDMNLRLDVMEQQSRSSNVEIQCLPEHKGENLVSTVMNIGKVISCSIAESNIHRVTRIAKLNASSNRPKSIIVQFNSPRIRDSFLAASIKFNKNKKPEDRLNSSLIGIGGKRENVYIVDHLSPKNKSLHAAARLKAKELSYRYVWVRKGRIYMRKTEDSDYIYIKDTDMLGRLV